MPVSIKQRIPRLDIKKPDGTTVEARVDVVTQMEGTSWSLDVAVESALSEDAAHLAGAARIGGHMAQRTEDRKRARYDDPNLVPIVLESHGRWGERGLEWLRRVNGDDKDGFNSMVKEITTIVQCHTAQAILAG